MSVPYRNMSDHDLLITLVAGQDELKKDVARINGSIAAAMKELGGVGGGASVRDRLHKLESDRHALRVVEAVQRGRKESMRMAYAAAVATVAAGAALATILVHVFG